MVYAASCPQTQQSVATGITGSEVEMHQLWLGTYSRSQTQPQRYNNASKINHTDIQKNTLSTINYGQKQQCLDTQRSISEI
jgi:hypothetical protein